MDPVDSFIRDRNAQAHASESYLLTFHGLGCQARPFDLVSLSSKFVLPVWQLSGAYEVSVVPGQVFRFEIPVFGCPYFDVLGCKSRFSVKKLAISAILEKEDKGSKSKSRKVRIQLTLDSSLKGLQRLIQLRGMGRIGKWTPLFERQEQQRQRRRKRCGCLSKASRS